MKYILVSAVILLSSCPGAVSAEVYTNDNLQQVSHERPLSFTQTARGGFTGVTEGGKHFTQEPIVADIHVRLHRFSIDQAYFYISSVGLITAPNDLVALSIYLAQVGWEEEVV